MVVAGYGQDGHGAGREALRTQLQGMWASVAPAWAEHADYADTRGADMTTKLLELSAPQPGERVLELACGPGGVGIAAAMLPASPGPSPSTTPTGWAGC
jgi:hypothetical protein